MMKIYLKQIPILSDSYRFLRLTAPLLMPARKSASGLRMVGSNSTQLQEKYEPIVAELLSSKLSRATRFVNVGANIGYWALMVRLGGFGGEIVLIEPDEMNLRLLTRNLKLNKIYDVTVKKVAASNYSGYIDLYGFGTGVSAIKGWAGGASHRRIKVRSQQLDSIVEVSPFPTFFLIDVEGHELAILQGVNLHFKQNSEFLIEIAISEHQPEGISINPNFKKIFKFMEDNGYEVFGWIPDYKVLRSTEIKSLMQGKLENKSQMYHFIKKDSQIR